MPVNPELRRQRQEDFKFEAILSYTSRSCPKKKKNKVTQFGRQTYFYNWRAAPVEKLLK
jgi:hypothetical protein